MLSEQVGGIHNPYSVKSWHINFSAHCWLGEIMFVQMPSSDRQSHSNQISFSESGHPHVNSKAEHNYTERIPSSLSWGEALSVCITQRSVEITLKGILKTIQQKISKTALFPTVHKWKFEKFSLKQQMHVTIWTPPVTIQLLFTTFEGNSWTEFHTEQHMKPYHYNANEGLYLKQYLCNSNKMLKVL